MPANASLPDLTATQAIALLCARDITSAQYVQALFDRYDSGGFECLNAFISLNRTQVCHQSQFTQLLTRLYSRLQCMSESPMRKPSGPSLRLTDLHAATSLMLLASHALMTQRRILAVAAVQTYLFARNIKLLSFPDCNLPCIVCAGTGRCCGN